MANTLAHVRDALSKAGYLPHDLGTSTRGPSIEAHARRKVIIWQAAGGSGHDMTFMYRPVTDTLIQGFKSPPKL